MQVKLPKCLTSTDNKAKGFTLVELLVVLAILSLLIAIIAPSMSRAREQARRTVCKSNLYHIGKAYHLYMCESEETSFSKFLYFQFDTNRMNKYYGKGEIFLCPSDNENTIEEIDNIWLNVDNSVRASYYVGYRYSFLPENKVHKEHLEEIAAFWDINGGSDIFISGVNHYSEGGNVLFLDDHVEWIPQELWVNQNMPIK